MINIPALTRRELGSFFHSPMAYIVGVLFLVISGAFFYVTAAFSQQASLRDWAQLLIFILIFVAPILSMRQFSEEKRVGTIETLMTTPVTDTEVVLSKFLGVFLFYLALLAPTLLYIPIMRALTPPGSNLDYGSFATAYAAIILTGMFFLAFGLFASALTNNQIVAAVAGIVTLFLVAVVAGLVPEPGSFPGLSPGQRALKSLCTAVQFLHTQKHVDSFIKGVIDTRDLVYFLAFTIYFLFLTVRVLENRKWK